MCRLGGTFSCSGSATDIGVDSSGLSPFGTDVSCAACRRVSAVLAVGFSPSGARPAAVGDRQNSGPCVKRARVRLLAQSIDQHGHVFLGIQPGCSGCGRGDFLSGEL